MKFLKVCLIILASLLMAAIIYFIDDSSVIDSVSATYFIVINSFLGIDMAAMIKQSKALPGVEHKEMKFYRYILSFVFMIILFLLMVYRKETDGINAVVAMSAFSSGAMMILALVLSGLEGNKLAARAGMK